MTKNKLIFLCMAIGLLNTTATLAKRKKRGCCGKETSSRQIENKRPSKRYKAREAPEGKVSFGDKVKNWIEKTWNNAKSLVRKAKDSVKKNLDRPENATRKKWKSSQAYHKDTFKKQKLAHKAEALVNSHHVDSEDLLIEVEDSGDQQFKKYAQRYNRQARRAKQEAESGRKDLEFALRNIAKESEALQRMNEENLEKIKIHRDALLEYQHEAKRARRSSGESI